MEVAGNTDLVPFAADAACRAALVFVRPRRIAGQESHVCGWRLGLGIGAGDPTDVLSDRTGRGALSSL
jgi:hypothetical protein